LGILLGHCGSGVESKGKNRDDDTVEEDVWAFVVRLRSKKTRSNTSALGFGLPVKMAIQITMMIKVLELRSSKKTGRLV
jgi:hypothetical protein